MDYVSGMDGGIKMSMIKSFLRALETWILPPVPFFVVFLVNEVSELTWVEAVGVFMVSVVVMVIVWFWLAVAISNRIEGEKR